MGEAYIAGVAMTDIGWHEEDPHDMGARVCAEALRDAGLLPAQVEGLISTPHGYMADTRKMITQRMADYLGITCGLMLDVDSGGNSTSVAVHIARDRIREGRISSCLVFAAQREAPPNRIKEDIIGHFHLIKAANSLYDSYQAAYGLISPLPFYAMAVQRYMHLHSIPPEDIARVAAVLRGHALKHPQAAYKEPLTVEEVLASSFVSPPIRRLECSEMHDGAAAVVLVGEELARENPRAVRIAGMAEAHDPTSFAPYRGEISRFPCVGRAARAALEESGYALSEVEVAEVYGAFAGMEPMMYEELGFFAPGEAPGAVREGRTTHGGEVLLNPSGGRLSLGHPAYVTPLLEFTEIVRQLRGEAAERQRPGAQVGLVHTEQGFINGSIVAVLDREGSEMDTRPYMQDRAAREFFSLLERGEFRTTRCRSCGGTHYPPRVVCPACLGEEMEWVDLPREGKLLAFTQQRDAMRCRKPEVLGLVELEGIGNVFTRVDAPLEELRIGMRMAFDTWTSPDGVALHQFRPLE